MNAEETNEYILLRKRGYRYLFRGVIFLGIVLVIGQLVEYFNVPFAGLIAESTIVLGWVAVWRPVEIFLYDLPELKDKKPPRR